MAEILLNARRSQSSEAPEGVLTLSKNRPVRAINKFFYLRAHLPNFFLPLRRGRQPISARLCNPELQPPTRLPIPRCLVVVREMYRSIVAIVPQNYSQN